MTIHHLNCGTLHAPPNPKASCHCLLLEAPTGLTLIDTGIGLHDVRAPLGRIGRQLIDLAGFQFNEAETAVRQVERLGFRADDVRHVVLTHADPDHAGGLADFPHAEVHISVEERAALGRGNPRYLPVQFAHGPRWVTHPPSSRRWYGLEARPLDLGLATEVLLVPLFGHTLGHCGVAVPNGDRWRLHVGDAYYLRVVSVVGVGDFVGWCRVFEAHANHDNWFAWASKTRHHPTKTSPRYFPPTSVTPTLAGGVGARRPPGVGARHPAGRRQRPTGGECGRASEVVPRSRVGG